MMKAQGVDGRPGPAMTTRDKPTGPMTLGNMRQHGARALDVTCRACGHRTEVNVDAWSDDVPVPSFGPRMRGTIKSGQPMPAQRESAMVTKEELIDFACEVTGGNVKDLSADQMRKLMTIMQRLAECSLDELKSFGQLCAMRTDIDAAVTAGTDDFVTLRLTKEQCAFLLALIDREIREHT
jgi:hypothetical protein